MLLQATKFWGNVLCGNKKLIHVDVKKTVSVFCVQCKSMNYEAKLPQKRCLTSPCLNFFYYKIGSTSYTELSNIGQGIREMSFT